MTALVDTSVLVEDDASTDQAWSISVITLGELEVGVLAAREASTRARRLRRLTAVLAEAQVLPVDPTVAARYGELRAATGRLSTNDLWIAATALAHDLLLVTADERMAALPLVRSRLVGDAAS